VLDDTITKYYCRIDHTRAAARLHGVVQLDGWHYDDVKCSRDLTLVAISDDRKWNGTIPSTVQYTMTKYYSLTINALSFYIVALSCAAILQLVYQHTTNPRHRVIILAYIRVARRVT